MRKFRRASAYALMTAAASIAASSAFAGCSANQMNGNWHFFALQANTPKIKPANQVVETGGNATKTIKVFPQSGGFDNATALAIKCAVTVSGASAAGASLNGTCDARGVVQNDGGTGINVSGNVTLNLCTVTGGSLDVGDGVPVTFLGGHFNGVNGTGVAYQGQPQVFLWTMIKD